MARILTALILVFFLQVFCNGGAKAAIFLDGSTLTDLLAPGEFTTDLDFSYSSASDILRMDILSPTAEAKWAPLSDANMDSITATNIPFRMNYGVSDKLSARVSMPYTSLSLNPKNGTDSSSSGLGNIEAEGLYGFWSEDESKPSFSALARIKLGTGKKYSQLAVNELPVGTRSTDLTLAGIVAKRYGSATWKGLLGYVHPFPYSENLSGGSYPDFDISLTDQLIFSTALIYPTDDHLTMGGELWGAYSLNKEKWYQTVAGQTITTEFQNSGRGQMVLSPYISYRVNESFTLKGAADLIVWKAAAVTTNIAEWFKWNTITLAGSYIL